MFKKVIITNTFDRTLTVECETLEEYEKYIKKHNNAVESIGRAGQLIRPVFDLDAYNNDIDLNSFFEDIKLLYPNKDIYSASRGPRQDGDKGLKYSYRVYVDGVKTTSSQIKALLLSNGIDRKWDCLDLSIYDKNKVLLLPLTTCKTKKTRHGQSNLIVPSLEPFECDIFKCCASYIEENFEDYTNRNPDLIKKEKEAVLDDIKHDAIEKIIEIDEKSIASTIKKLNEIIIKLTNERATKYDTWTNMLWCLINILKNKNTPIRSISDVCHIFSKKGENYDATATDKFIDTNYDTLKEASYGWKYLYDCLKEDNLEYYESITTDTYDVFKKKFELTHAKILYPSPMVIYYDKGFWEVMKIKNVADTYIQYQCKKWVIDKKGKGEWVKIPFILEWLKDPKMRFYNRLVFKPPPVKVNNDEFNLWKDFDIDSIANIENIKIDPINDKRNYWKEYKIYANNLLGDEKVANYILARYAMRLQIPSKRSNVILIICGTEGDGKNRMLEPIYKIFGEYAQILDKSSKLYDTHSMYEYKKLLVRIDEAGGLANFTNADALKARATENKLSINPKGIQAFTIDNFCDYDMTTNNHNVVKISDESTRRYFQVETTPYYQGNIDFFNDYIINIECNPIAIKQIYDGLMEFDWKAIVPSENFQDARYKPITSITAEVKEQNRDKIIVFLESFIRPLTIANYDKEIYKIPNIDLFNKYKNWCISISYKEDINAISFGMKLNKLMKNTLCITKDTHSNTLINIPNCIKYYEKIGISFTKETEV
jgi:hypothetical protein